MVNSKVEVCNMALSRLGDKGTVENIDDPKKPAERDFNLWYDTARQASLKLMAPSFSRDRDIWPKLDYTPAFGYAYAYKYRNDCLRVLGIGNLDVKQDDYSIEGDMLLTNEHYPNGLPVRFVKDVIDVSKFTADFVRLFSFQLAYDVCMGVTNSTEKMAYMEQVLPMKIVEYCGTDAQENKPIRITRSPILEARAGLVRGSSKK